MLLWILPSLFGGGNKKPDSLSPKDLKALKKCGKHFVPLTDTDLDVDIW